MNQRYVRGTKRDKEGQRICNVCAKPLTGRRTAYCSDECWHRNTPSIMRNKVARRDKGVCSLCGLDTKTVQLDFRRLRYGGMTHLWEADHIVPVSEGGGLCGVDGYRTLCKGPGTNNCHGKETGKLRKRLNERKRIEQQQKATGKLF